MRAIAPDGHRALPARCGSARGGSAARQAVLARPRPGLPLRRRSRPPQVREPVTGQGPPGQFPRQISPKTQRRHRRKRPRPPQHRRQWPPELREPAYRSASCAHQARPGAATKRRPRQQAPRPPRSPKPHSRSPALTARGPAVAVFGRQCLRVRKRRALLAGIHKASQHADVVPGVVAQARGPRTRQKAAGKTIKRKTTVIAPAVLWLTMPRSGKNTTAVKST